MRRNGFDRATRTITVRRERAAAIAQVRTHYSNLFGGGASEALTRSQYAIPENLIMLVPAE